jgi:hypothetical protein
MSMTRAPERVWSEGRVTLFLFLGLWLTYAFIGPRLDQSSVNEFTRMGLVYAIIDRHALDLGDFGPLTMDKAMVGGIAYADKAPGLSLMALPVVALVTAIDRFFDPGAGPIFEGGFTPLYMRSVFWAILATNALFTAAAAAALYRLGRLWHAGRDAACFGALCYGLASPAEGWSTTFFGHALAGDLLFLGFAAILWVSSAAPPRASAWAAGGLVGLLLGWAVVVEYTSAPGAILIGLFGLWRLKDQPPPRRLRLVAGILAAGLIAGLPLAVYNYAIFGSILHLSYENVVGFAGMRTGFLGISVPSGTVLLELLFGRFRGLLWVAPVFLLAPFGYVALWRTQDRAVVLTLLAVPLAYLLINAGYFYWDGGGSTGPRHLVPGLVFACAGFMPLWQRGGERRRMLYAGVAALSATVSLVCATVNMTIHNSLKDPLFQDLLPRFRAGNIHDLPMWFGLHGLWTLTGLPLIWIACWLLLDRLPVGRLRAPASSVS